MKQKRYQIKQACPQCGCSAVSNLSHEEMMARFGDVPNVEMECSECMAKYQAEMKEVCPEWDDECRMKQS
ncbi:MAG: hypothetical protein ACLFPD_10225 [Desulfosudaceae bacterium]